MKLLRRAADAGDDRSAAAEAVLRLAVLLQAGIHPQRAWQYLASSGDAVAQRVQAGSDIAATLREIGPDWQPVGAAWKVAEIVGAPLADSLRAVAGALRDAEECADEARVALAEPAGTARLMSWLPLVAVGLALALGFDVVGVFVSQPVGAVCVIAGVMLMICARRWTRKLVRAAAPPPGVPGLDAELMAIALSGGVSLERARSVVSGATQVQTSQSTADTLALSRSAGVPAVELLRATAALARHHARTEGRVRAAKLSSHLLVPLGVCTLPAFLLLGVAPMFLSVLASTPMSI
ncbi:tight adherence protein B [Microbacterium endophyticum]|uniref:Tight adherence protein B n=1 Tax=Microbacterium endophyticum TaxID=1526412 RepID=A0A7W4V1G8_9MICO|nr:type II secretion system F family protein [Microbacterium endophyticum]MBB2975133.1 tight adherence protein B [Microbacterium endophyticum]NIK37327.1 tight adherence protein B [Microbacterium endophyticum]